MSSTIKLPYSKKSDYSIIRPMIKSGIGIGITTGVMKLLHYMEMKDLFCTTFSGCAGSVVQIIMNLCSLESTNTDYKVLMTEKGMVCIESTLKSSDAFILVPFLGLFVSLVPMLRMSVYNENINTIIEKSLLQFVLPVVNAVASEYCLHSEKIYEHRCIDYKNKIVSHHHSEYGYYTTTKFATDYSQKLVCVGIDEFEILHYDEHVEVLYE